MAQGDPVRVGLDTIIYPGVLAALVPSVTERRRLQRLGSIFFLPPFGKNVLTSRSKSPDASLQKFIPVENKKYGGDIFNIIVGNKKYIVENNLFQRSVGRFLAKPWNFFTPEISIFCIGLAPEWDFLRNFVR
jgi:hypothetical protein